MSIQPMIEPQFRDLSARFTLAIKDLDNIIQSNIHTLGARWVQYAKAEAPIRTGQFVTGIGYIPFRESEDAVGFAGISPQPIGNWIKFGTQPHKIAARNTDALRFYWKRTGYFTIVPRKGGFKTHAIGRTLYVGKGFVDHPGTKPNPYHLRAYDKYWPEVQEEVKRISKSFVVTVVRGISGRPA